MKNNSNNPNSFAHQNKPSFRDNRQQLGDMPSRNNPHVGTQKFDYKDNVIGKDAQRAYMAKYASENSDAEYSAKGIRRKDFEG